MVGGVCGGGGRIHQRVEINISMALFEFELPLSSLSSYHTRGICLTMKFSMNPLVCQTRVSVVVDSSFAFEVFESFRELLNN
jgi:hypothetical protein